MNICALLFLSNISACPLSGTVGFNTSYITKVQDLVGFPLSAIVLNPIVECEYKRFGITADNLYISADCISDSVDLHLGLNCQIYTPYYRISFGNVQVSPCIGMLRIDAAGLASGQLGSFSYAGTIDETRMGIYGGVKTTFAPIPKIKLKLLLSSAFLKEGTFGEISTSLMFKPFIKNTYSETSTSSEDRASFFPSLLEHIYLTANLSFAQITVSIDEDSKPLPATLVIYLIGVGYDF